MTETRARYDVTIERDDDGLPARLSYSPADGQEHTAFSLSEQRMIVDWFIGGRSVMYIADFFNCTLVHIEQVLRVRMEPMP